MIALLVSDFGLFVASLLGFVCCWLILVGLAVFACLCDLLKMVLFCVVIASFVGGFGYCDVALLRVCCNFVGGWYVFISL